MLDIKYKSQQKNISRKSVFFFYVLFLIFASELLLFVNLSLGQTARSANSVHRRLRSSAAHASLSFRIARKLFSVQVEVSFHDDLRQFTQVACAFPRILSSSVRTVPHVGQLDTMELSREVACPCKLRFAQLKLHTSISASNVRYCPPV